MITFDEFMEPFSKNECVLHIKDTAAFREVYARLVETGLCFPSGSESIEYVIHDGRNYPYLMIEQRMSKSVLLFCGAHERRIVEADKIDLGSSIAEELMSLLGGD